MPYLLGAIITIHEPKNLPAMKSTTRRRRRAGRRGEREKEYVCKANTMLYFAPAVCPHGTIIIC
jgi:hypothetical protein